MPQSLFPNVFLRNCGACGGCQAGESIQRSLAPYLKLHVVLLDYAALALADQVTLFKREKKRRVYSLLDLQEKPIPRKRKEFAQDLTEEELAKLPQPSEGTHDNLPSSFTATNKGAVGKLPEPVAKSTDNLPSVAKAPASTPKAAATSPSAEGSAAEAPATVAASAPKLDDQQLPSWVEGVDQLANEASNEQGQEEEGPHRRRGGWW